MDYFFARDGEKLHYQVYSAASSNHVMILLHGISEDHKYLKGLAEPIAERNLATVYTPDLRGYGDHAKRKGDVDYIGQHEDDLEDFIQHIKKKHKNPTITLAGHSAGGGTVLRLSEHPSSSEIDRYLLLAPFIHHSAPTVPKKNEKSYGKANLGRLIPLFILNGFGIRKWNHWIVYESNKPVEKRHGSETLALSHRLFVSRYPEKYKQVIANMKKPTLVLVGEHDQEFIPDAFEPLFRENNKAETHVLKDTNHDGIIKDPQTIEWIENWMTQGDQEKSV
ncbi:alpha/beta fold hydrolase [Gracilibacillus sp. YIM 98692]|uniref:alpha/beta hydrolase n=1 Tax=Gracilibacillus sp. YIM 98692 TaxID=2663532 RepID=UPI0013D32585|nr:alpha/beta fold hydrolase [Gracilibacillus sp. YIM 98692]